MLHWQTKTLIGRPQIIKFISKMLNTSTCCFLSFVKKHVNRAYFPCLKNNVNFVCSLIVCVALRVILVQARPCWLDRSTLITVWWMAWLLAHSMRAAVVKTKTLHSLDKQRIEMGVFCTYLGPTQTHSRFDDSWRPTSLRFNPSVHTYTLL